MSVGTRLGESVNLLQGLAPGWFGGAGERRPFEAPPHEALLGLEAKPQPGIGAWCGLDIAFHASIESLLDALFDYRVRPMPGDAGHFDLPPSVLMLGGGRRAATLARLEHLLGVPVAQLERGGLVLLQFRRDDAGERHPLEEGGVGRRIQVERYWTREGRHAVGRLRVAERGGDGREPVLRQRQATRYVDYLYEYGTHFVSRIGMGDRLFQVLACQPGRHDLLRSVWRQAAGMGEPGVSAAAFAAYTSDAWIGWHGHLISAAQDPAFEHSLLEGRWRLPEAGMRASLLAGLHRDAGAWFGGFRCSVPVRLGFNAHSPYMEPSRASAWQRLAKGALLQRYGDAVLVSAAGAGGAEPPPLVNPGENIVVAGHDGDHLLADRTDAIPAQLSEAVMHAGVAHLFARRLGFGSDVVLPVQGTLTLFGFAIDADLARGRMPTVHLQGDAAAVVHCHTPALRGAMRIARPDGRQQVLFGGLHFGDDAQGRVAVLADLCQADAATLAAVRLPLTAALDEAEAQWLRAIAAGVPATIDTIRSELDWLVRCLRDSESLAPEAAPRGAWDALFRRVALLARLGPTVPRVRRDAAAALIQTAAELLLHCRLANDAPESEQQALAHACTNLSLGFDAATDHSMEPDAGDLARLAQCLVRIDGACAGAVRAIESLLEAAPVAFDDQAQVLLLAMARLWGDEFAGAALPPAPGEERIALAMELLRAAEHDRRAAKLLHAVATHADIGVVDAAVAAMDGLGKHGLMAEQWAALPDTLMSLLDASGAAGAALSDALRAWAAQGLRLAMSIPAMQQGAQDRLRRERMGTALAQAAPLRMLLASRRLQLQWLAAYGQLAGDAVERPLAGIIPA